MLPRAVVYDGRGALAILCMGGDNWLCCLACPPQNWSASFQLPGVGSAAVRYSAVH